MTNRIFDTQDMYITACTCPDVQHPDTGETIIKPCCYLQDTIRNTASAVALFVFCEFKKKWKLQKGNDTCGESF